MKVKILLLCLVGLIIAYGFWRGEVGLDYADDYTPIDSVIISFQNNPTSNNGNLIGVQPFMSPSDYSSSEAFYKSVENYLFDASAKQFLNEKSIVVFPEYMGTWLVALDEKPAVYRTEKVEDAMRWIVLRHPFDFLRYYSKSKSPSPDKEAIFQLKSSVMASAYFTTFSKLASKYNVTIVAGSILLPEPYVDEQGMLRVNPEGKLYNTTAVFQPNGSIHKDLVKKIYPTEDEKGFVCAAGADSLPVFDTPAGKLGVLICADSWFPQPYQSLKEKGVELLAVPSYAIGNGIWSRTWSGYSGAPMPDDVDKNDVGKISERDAWLKYAMPSRAGQAGIKYGINVFLRGNLWDLGADGETIITGEGNVVVVPFKKLSETQSTNDLITSMQLR